MSKEKSTNRRAKGSRPAANADPACNPPVDAVLAGMLEAVIGLDADWRIVCANEAAAQLLGQSVNAVIGQSVWDLLPADSHESLRSKWQIVRDEGLTARFHCQVRTWARWLDMCATSVGDMLLIFWQDITSVRQATQAMAQSDAWSRRTIEGMLIGVYVTDLDGRLLRYNRAAAAMWGREPRCSSGNGDQAEMFCGSLRMFNSDGRQVIPHDQSPMAQVLTSGQPLRNGQIIVERPDGSRRCVMVNPAPVYDDRGRMIGAVNCMVDMSDGA